MATYGSDVGIKQTDLRQLELVSAGTAPHEYEAEEEFIQHITQIGSDGHANWG